MNRLARATACAVACAVAACGGAASDQTPKEAAAERAYAAGRYEEAAARFAEAAATSRRPRDREEALYRQAMSLERAGRADAARPVLESLLRTFPRGARAARATYDLALLEIAQGDAGSGRRLLDVLVRTHPESGLAPDALRRCLDALGENGEPAVRAYLETLEPHARSTELAQYVDYEHARSYERQGELDAARAEYLRVADRYPYPRGVFWDDALYRAGDIDVTLGAPSVAITVFERLLAEREPSILQGSYERGRYAEAAFRVAELYRDALRDPTQARREFEAFFRNYPTSRLRDDAAWSAALLAVDAGDRTGACRLLSSLGSASPHSRYVACGTALCSSFRPPPGTGACHDYALRAPPRP